MAAPPPLPKRAGGSGTAPALPSTPTASSHDVDTSSAPSVRSTQRLSMTGAPSAGGAPKKMALPGMVNSGPKQPPTINAPAADGSSQHDSTAPLPLPPRRASQAPPMAQAPRSASPLPPTPGSAQPNRQAPAVPSYNAPAPPTGSSHAVTGSNPFHGSQGDDQNFHDLHNDFGGLSVQAPPSLPVHSNSTQAPPQLPNRSSTGAAPALPNRGPSPTPSLPPRAASPATGPGPAALPPRPASRSDAPPPIPAHNSPLPAIPGGPSTSGGPPPLPSHNRGPSAGGPPPLPAHGSSAASSGGPPPLPVHSSPAPGASSGGPPPLPSHQRGPSGGSGAPPPLPTHQSIPAASTPPANLPPGYGSVGTAQPPSLPSRANRSSVIMEPAPYQQPGYYQPQQQAEAYASAGANKPPGYVYSAVVTPPPSAQPAPSGPPLPGQAGYQPVHHPAPSTNANQPSYGGYAAPPPQIPVHQMPSTHHSSQPGSRGMTPSSSFGSGMSPSTSGSDLRGNANQAANQYGAQLQTHAQREAGAAAGRAAEDRGNQKAAGEAIAARSDNRLVQGLARNSFVQKQAGAQASKAANDEQNQQMVGDAVVSNAKSQASQQYNKPRSGSGSNSGSGGGRWASSGF